MLINQVAVLALAILAILAMVGSASADCSEKGFTPSLACSTCTALKKESPSSSALQGMIQDCMDCCTPDNGDPLFTSAVLKICEWQLPQFPEVKSFMERMAAQKNGPPVQQVSPSANECTEPTLMLLDDARGTTTANWDVSGWNADQIQAFVKAKVASSST